MDFSRLQASSKIGDDWVYPQPPCLNFGWLEVDQGPAHRIYWEEYGNPAGEPQKIAEYYAVSEDKLRALPAEKLVELRDNGALGQIYAHLVSLLGWDRLIAMAFARAAAVPTAANA